MATLSTRIRDLDRASALAQASARLGRVAAAIDKTNRSLTLPRFDSQTRREKMESLGRDNRNQHASRSELINHLNPTADRSVRLGGAMIAASRLGRAIESSRAVHAAATVRRALPASIEKAALSSRIMQSLEAKHSSRLRDDLQANVSIATSVRAIKGVHLPEPREIAHSSTPNMDTARPQITLSSSPTVIINATAAGSTVRHDVLEALRAHREELFDQLKRESVRRERAQF
jgi:hypothetical protein